MLGGCSCGRRRDRLQVLASEAPGIWTLTGGHTPHLKGQLGGLCGAGFRGARRSLWAPAPEGAWVGCRRNIRVYRGALESSPTSCCCKASLGSERPWPAQCLPWTPVLESPQGKSRNPAGTGAGRPLPSLAWRLGETGGHCPALRREGSSLPQREGL